MTKEEATREALELALGGMKKIAYLKLQPDSIQNLTDHYITAIKEALAQPEQERNFCQRCGKRLGKNDWDVHTCTPPQPEQEPVAWRDHVEQRLLTWRQSFINRSGDQLALDDFMDKRSLDDLIEFVCDEYTTPPQPKEPEQEPVAWMVTSELQDGTKNTYPITGRFKDVKDVCDFGNPIPLYTILPQQNAEHVSNEQVEPVAWMRDDEMKAMVSDEKRAWILCGRSELIEDYNKPLYTTPPQRTWVGLTDDDIEMIVENKRAAHWEFVRQVESILKEKNT